MIVIYLGCFLLLLYYLYTKSFSYWESRGVSCEKPSFPFGNFGKVASKKQHIRARIREVYDTFKTPYVGMYIFNQPHLIIRDPEIVKKVLVKDFDKFVNRQFASNESVDPIAAHSMFSSTDDIWKNIRTKLSPVFTSGKMKLMLPLMKECAMNLHSYLENHDGEVLEIMNVFKKYAVDIISSCAFGINSNCLKNENSEILKFAIRLLDTKSFTRNFSFFCYFFAPKLVNLFGLTLLDKSATDFLQKMFKDVARERNKKNIVRNDLIDQLKNLNGTEGVNSDLFESIQITSQAITFFTAGNDTTAMTITYTLYELALNKAIQDRLRDEVTQTFKKHGDFTYEALQETKYLDMILNETLRKYPLVAFLNRLTTSEYTFEETGLTLDKDVSVLIPVPALHFDPEYFPDPEKFYPERFSDENKHNIKPFTFLPFGDGPRNCIGQRLALLVSKIALAAIIKDFAFERCEKTSVPLNFDPSSMFLVDKNGIHLRVVKL